MRAILIAIFCVAGIFAHSQFFVASNNETGILHQYQGGEYGGGVSFADWNKDGWDDLSISQNNAAPQFYLNDKGVFVLQNSFISNSDQIKSLIWVDIDNDDDRDLCVTRMYQPIEIYLNNGNDTYSNISSSCGITQTVEWMSCSTSWGDYNLDGFIDVYISNYNGPGYPFPNITNYLYRNNGNGTFSDVTVNAGVGNGSLYTFQAIWTDYDHDGWQDIFLINDRTCPACSNYLYHNNGNGTFTDVSNAADINYIIYAMNAAGDDYDNDNDLDFYITNNPAGNLLHNNQGNGTFIETSMDAGVALYEYSWAAQFFDADNDGWQDLHVSASPFWQSIGQNTLFKNQGDGTFSDNTIATGLATDFGISHSSAIGDFNNDGLTDLFVVKDVPNWSTIWKNVTTNDNHFLKVTCNGVESNRDGIGTWITCYADDNTYTRYVYCGEGYLGQNSFTENIGLGSSNVIDSLKLEWLSGTVDTWYNFPADQNLVLEEGSSLSTPIVVIGELNFCEGDSVTLDAGEFETYQWSNGYEGRYNVITESGNYSVVVTDAYGFEYDPSPVSVVVFENPVIAEQTFQVSCYGECDGSIILENTNGTGISAVQWTGVESADPVVGNLCGDYNYSYLVTDDHGCNALGETYISQPDSLVMKTTVGEILCYNLSATVMCQISGGTPPYEIPDELPGEFYVGNYSFIITDLNDCEVPFVFELDQPSALSGVLELTHASLVNGPGSAIAYPYGGTPPYHVSWSTEETGDSISNLDPGEYTVYITDLNECYWEGEFVIGYNLVDALEEIEFEIYPNPVSDVIHFSNSRISKTGSYYKIFNAFGELVNEGILTNDPLKVSDLAPGIFYLQVIYDDQYPSVKKFIKITGRD